MRDDITEIRLKALSADWNRLRDVERQRRRIESNAAFLFVAIVIGGTAVAIADWWL